MLEETAKAEARLALALEIMKPRALETIEGLARLEAAFRLIEDAMAEMTELAEMAEELQSDLEAAEKCQLPAARMYSGPGCIMAIRLKEDGTWQLIPSRSHLVASKGLVNMIECILRNRPKGRTLEQLRMDLGLEAELQDFVDSAVRVLIGTKRAGRINNGVYAHQDRVEFRLCHNCGESSIASINCPRCNEPLEKEESTDAQKKS